MLKTIRRVRESSSMCTIAIKRGFRSHPRGLMDLRLKHFKQKLTPMERLMEGVLLRYNIRWENLFRLFAMRWYCLITLWCFKSQPLIRFTMPQLSILNRYINEIIKMKAKIVFVYLLKSILTSKMATMRKKERHGCLVRYLSFKDAKKMWQV